MFKVGELLGDRYQIQSRLSKKPGRQTFLALDLQTQTQVIVKLLIFGADLEWDDFKLFEREAQVLRSLSHPAIPQYLNAFELEGIAYKGFVLVQSYIDAPSLAAYQAVGRTFNETDLKQIAEQLLEILIDLHQRHPPIIHRDIKPSNILLSSRSGNSVGQIYLVDFGSVQNAIAIDREAFTTTGTYGYIPLEQFGGRAVPASDLYSLGATLIHLITGHHPADLPQHQGQMQFDSSLVSPSFYRWLAKLTKPDLEQRFNTAQEALQALKQPRLDDLQLMKNPQLSEIQFTKSGEKLQIVIPGDRLFEKTILEQLWSATGWIIASLVVISLVSFPIGMISTGYILLTAILSIPATLFRKFGRIKLQIDQDYISLSHSIGRWQTQQSLRSPRAHINKIEWNDLRLNRFKDPESNQFFYRKILPSISIWSGTQEYTLPGLRGTEIEWLSHELSHWLNLPVYRREVLIISPDGKTS